MTTVDNIKVMGFTKLTNAEYHSFHQDVITFVSVATEEAIHCTSETIAAYSEALAQVQDLVNRQSLSLLTSQIEAEDAERDRYTNFIFMSVDAATYSPDSATVALALDLQKELKVYRGITESALAAETSEVKGMINVLSQEKYKDDTKLMPSLTAAITSLGNSNRNTEALMQQRNSDAPTSAESKKKRDAVSDIYDVIVQNANAAAIFIPSDALTGFIKNVNNTIDKYNLVVKQRLGKEHSKKEELPAEN